MHVQRERVQKGRDNIVTGMPLGVCPTPDHDTCTAMLWWYNCHDLESVKIRVACQVKATRRPLSNAIYDSCHVALHSETNLSLVFTQQCLQSSMAVSCILGRNGSDLGSTVTP